MDWSLPLNGYYRLGRYMPVRFLAGADDFHVCPDGIVQTVVASPTGGVAPCFMSRAPSSDSPFFSQLHELSPDEKLVGIAADAGDLASQLFPGEKILTVPLDPVHPLSPSPIAWQTFDAVVIGPDAAANLIESKRLTVVLAGGTSIAVPATGEKPPSTDWPWTLEHGFWIARAPTPLNASPNDDAYKPVAGWFTGLPLSDRWFVVELGLIAAIVILLISLWRSRWRAAIAVICAITGIEALPGLAAFMRDCSITTGTIYSHQAVDTWEYQRAFRACSLGKQYGLIGSMTFPLLTVHGGPDHVKLDCYPDGVPNGIEIQLPAHAVTAFVSRTVAKRDGPLLVSDSSHMDSPLRYLVPSIYPEYKVAAQIDQGEPDDWPSLVLAPSSTRDSSNK